MNNDVILKIPLAEIATSPFNKERSRRYSETELRGLGKNMREHGQIEPAIVRERPGVNGQRYELAAGERRWRAATLEGLETLDCIVREMGDRAVCGVLLSENLQRVQPTPVEEADTFADLLAARDELGVPIYPTRKSLADAIGKTEDDIANRLAMREAPAALLEALNDGRIGSAMICTEVGRMTVDEKTKELAAKLILQPEDEDRGDKPLNYLETKALIRERFMTSLTGCAFDKEDPKLVPVTKDDSGTHIFGGACAACPALSGNRQDLARELATSVGGRKGVTAGLAANMCTNPECFRKKVQADWEKKKKDALAKGQKVIEGDAAKKIFGGWRGEISNDSAYAELDAKPGYGHIGSASYDNSKTFAQLLKGVEVEPVLAFNPHTRKIHRLVNAKEAIAAIKKHADEEGGKDPFGKKAAEKSPQEINAKKAENDREKLKKELAYESARRLQRAIGEKGLGLEELDLVFNIALGHSGADGQYFLGKMLSLETEKSKYSSGRSYGPAVLAWFKEHATTANGKLGYIVLALEARVLKWSGVDINLDWEAKIDDEDDDPPGFEKLAHLYKLDLEALEKELQQKAAAEKEKKPVSKLPMKSRSKAVLRNEAAVSADQMSKRKTEDYRCDHCGKSVEVPFGSGNEAAALGKGEMKCKKHGGKWQLTTDFEKQHGLLPDRRSGIAKPAKKPGSSKDSIEWLLRVKKALVKKKLSKKVKKQAKAKK